MSRLYVLCCKMSVDSGGSYTHDEQESVFDATSFRAFVPPLDHWQRKIIQCVLDDSVEAFSGSCAELSIFMVTNIQVDELQVSWFHLFTELSHIMSHLKSSGYKHWLCLNAFLPSEPIQRKLPVFYFFAVCEKLPGCQLSKSSQTCHHSAHCCTPLSSPSSSIHFGKVSTLPIMECHTRESLILQYLMFCEDYACFFVILLKIMKSANRYCKAWIFYQIFLFTDSYNVLLVPKEAYFLH